MLTMKSTYLEAGSKLIGNLDVEEIKQLGELKNRFKLDNYFKQSTLYDKKPSLKEIGDQVDPKTYPNYSNYHNQKSAIKLQALHEAIAKQRVKKTSTVKQYFTNKATLISFLIFLGCKALQESFFTALPQVMSEYYNWTT